MEKSADSVRVMTWNLWWKFEQWEARLEAISASLAATDPDIVFLQEVWSDAQDGNQAQRLADHLGYQWTYAAATTIGSIELGNAILSRWPLTDSGSVALPASQAFPEGRCAVYAEVASPVGSLFATTAHLTWQRNNSVGRQNQVKALMDLIKERATGEWPPILGGDFNADPDSDEIGLIKGRNALSDDSLVFQDAWEQGGDGSAGITWTPESQHYAESRNREVIAMPWLKRRLDYLFVALPDGRPSDTTAVQVEKAWLVGNDGVNEGSDHYALVADLRPHRIG